MSWAATDVSYWLLVAPGASALYKHRSRRSIINQLLSAYSSRLLWQIKLLIRWCIGKFDRMIKRLSRLFSYRPCIKPSVDNCTRIRLGQLSTLGLDIWANTKTAV